jgi:hypothetical protein
MEDTITTLRAEQAQLQAQLDTCTDQKTAEGIYTRLAEIRTQLNSYPATVLWPDHVPDLEAIGVVAVLSSNPSTLDDLYPGRVHDLGYLVQDSQSPWSRSMMLRRLWQNATPATKAIIESMNVHPLIAALLTGDLV